MSRPARTGTLGRTGRLRAAQATASASTSRSTRNFTMCPSGRTGGEVNPAMQAQRAGGSVGILGVCPQVEVRMDVDGGSLGLEVRRSHSNGGNCGELLTSQVRWPFRPAQALWTATGELAGGCGARSGVHIGGAARP